MSLERPPLPQGFDNSRARERRADPGAWRFDDTAREGVWRAIAGRRDIRRFRPEPIPEALLERLLEAAHQAPSVGLMQPWRFIIVRGEQTKAGMQALVARERLVQAEYLDQRARAYLDLKIEGIREAPLSLCACCDREPGREVLGRHTIRDTDLYSTCLAIENLWLAARAEGVGIGWVSFYREDDVRELLGIPAHVVPVAWLCVGYPDERPLRPGLEVAGWGRRHALEHHVFEERWGTSSEQGAPAPAPASAAAPRERAGAAPTPAWWRELAGGLIPADGTAAVRIRDASDELVKPAGSLGLLEGLLERWAAATGAAPATQLSTGILVLAADHGVATRGVSLFPARVSAQVAGAAARGESAIGVLARALGAELLVVDIGLRGAVDPAVIDRRIAAGSADITAGRALTEDQLRAAVKAGHAVAAQLAGRHQLLVLGEIGIANTTVAAALLAALTGLAPDEVCGRGTGVDAQGVERKRRAVADALAASGPSAGDPLGCLQRVGGLEFAGLVGALLAAAQARRPVVLDGLATSVAALVATRLEPAVRDYLIAGHRGSEPAHQLVLAELGLEPLLDLRLRLGEASGAALALPLIGLAARLHAEMHRFDDAGVDRAPQPAGNGK
jgi:nicotinate-nucleotide--dimethylbenzimidazole phosphoribosyltransferase